RSGPVASEQLGSELRDQIDVAMDRGLNLDHHPTQLVVPHAVLDLEGGALITLQVSHLLRLGVRPGPDVAVPDRVPERHQMGASARPVGRTDDASLLVEEARHLLGAHRDLIAARHRAGDAVAAPIASAADRTASRASSGSSTTASPASLSTSRTNHSTPAN